MHYSRKFSALNTCVYQQGISLIVFVFFLGLVTTAILIKSVSSNNLQINRSAASNNAMREARDALIGYALTYAPSATPTIPNPGRFPCGENTSLIGGLYEGSAASSCGSSVSIGRLAWKTVDIGDLKDGNNDELWYALSPLFSNSVAVINSDTAPTLGVDGIPNKAIAIIFSPGKILTGQSRPAPSSASPPQMANYLEGDNSNGDTAFVTGTASTTFNDQLLPIEPDDIFPALEKRVIGEFKNYLNAYKAVWGAFPYPATFGNPTTATYVGDTTLSGGFIPISNVNPTTTWNTSTTPVPAIVSPVGNVVSAPVCSFRNGNRRIRCDITIAIYNSANPPTVSISGIVNNVGLGFYDGLDVSSTSDVQITTRSGSATVSSASRAITHSLNSTGNGTVTFTGTLANTGVVRIEYRRTPPLSNWILAATNHYLLSNNWHHLIYYKVASPFLPGGTKACGSLCLTVNKINVSPNTTQTGIHALLISTGRKLDTTNVRPSPTYGTSNPAQVRPGSLLEDYFDSTNNIAGGLVFDGTNLPLTMFNDQVQIVE